MFSSTTFSSSRRRLQRANPSGAGEQVRAINLASAAPSKIRLRAEFGLCLRFSDASSPSSTSRRRRRPILLILVSSATEIALSLQPSPASDTSALSRMRAFVSSCAGLLPARTRDSSRSRSSLLSRTTYFLTAISFPATNQLHRPCATTEIQKNATESMTLATSGGRGECPADAADPARGRQSGGELADRSSACRRSGLDPAHPRAVLGGSRGDHAESREIAAIARKRTAARVERGPNYARRGRGERLRGPVPGAPGGRRNTALAAGQAGGNDSGGG